MDDRDRFERRLAVAIGEWAGAAPTEVDARALARSLASGMPRGRRIGLLSSWGLPSPGLAWAIGLVLVASLSVGLVASGSLHDLHILTGAPSASPVATGSVAPPTSAPSPSGPPASTFPSAPPSASPSPPPSSPEPSPGSASGPPATPWPAADLSWTGFQRLPRLHPGQALTDPIVGDVAAGGPGFVAVGSDWVDADGAVAVAWTSADGAAWEEHQIGNPGPTAVLSSPALSSVVAVDGQLVAAGRVGIWRSPDGSSWEESAAPHDLNGTPLHLAAGPGGFVAVGRSLDDPCQGRVWSSIDGVTWEPGALPDPSTFCPTAVAGGVSGYLAAGSDPASGRAALLLSGDGVTWEAVPDEAAFDGQGYPEGILWTADRWTAFGSFQPTGSSERGVRIWQSVDGLAWAATGFLRPSGPFACDAGSVHMLDATAFGAGFVAVGTCVVQPEQVGIAWTSADGATWQAVLGRVRPMSAVAAGGTRLVAVGSEWPDHQPIACGAVGAR